MKEGKKKIGEILVEAGIINSMQLSVALGEQKQWGGKFCSILTKLGFADERAIAEVLESQLGQTCTSLDDMTIPPDVLARVKIDIAKKYGVIPIEYDKSGLTVAISDPTDLATIDELSFTLGVRIKPVLALESAIRRAIAQYYEGVAPEIKPQKSILATAPEECVIIRDERGKAPLVSPERAAQPAEQLQKRDTSFKVAFEALLALLIDKGLITKEELSKKIREKSIQK